ncbi:MAG TPA: hypothetical protein VGB52_12390 [Actinomycetota bacterium]
MITAGNTGYTGVLYLLRRPGDLTDPIPGQDIALSAGIGFVALLAGVHVIRRLSTQDPPPFGETRLIAYLIILVHATILVLELAGLVDGAAGSEEVPPSRHVMALAIAAAMLTSSHWLRRRTPIHRTPG